MRVSGVPYEVEMPEKQYTMKFKFVHEAQKWPENVMSNVLTKEVEVSDCTSWMEVHEMFLDFLSAAYGYDIKEILKNDQDTSSNS